jgi:hypothetical protein
MHVIASWDLPCRRHILQQERDVSGVSSTMYLWKIFCLNIWCNLEFLIIWKCVHTMDLYIVKYLTIWVYVNLNYVWIWIEFKIFNYSLNLYLLNGVSWLKVANTIDAYLVSAGFYRSTPKILWLTPSRDFFHIDCVMAADTKDISLVSVDSNRHKNGRYIFGISQ